VSDDDDATETHVLADLLEQVGDGLFKADVPSRANALRRLRDFLLAVQANEELTTPAAIAEALKEAPRSPGFASYGPEITRALRAKVAELEKA